MIERPILFSGEMVRAILEGRKTQTRRVMKPQPILTDMWRLKHKDGYHDTWGKDFPSSNLNLQKHCPYGNAGDRLWVRETYGTQSDGKKWFYVYKARDGLDYDSDCPVKWRPSIFMPRTASRITLEITNIRVERIQNISSKDAFAEGCPAGHWPDKVPDSFIWFNELWDSINADRGYGWDKNPWVWAIEFRRVK